MLLRGVVVVLLIAMAFLAGIAWMRSSSHEPVTASPPTAEESAPEATAPEAATDPGLTGLSGGASAINLGAPGAPPGVGDVAAALARLAS